MMHRALAVLVSSLVCLAATAHAGDGRLEINQACVAAGCFAGDTPGLPVETQARQSYVLTSNLTLGAFTLGVILGAGSTLDLNGFAIEGNGICTGTPATCSQGLGGGGVIAGERAAVRNGTIRGVRSYGIYGGAFMRVENMRIEHNSIDGINGSDGPIGWLIEDCLVLENGRGGIALNYEGGSSGTRVVRNTIYGNQSAGIAGGISLLQDNSISDNGGLGAALGFSGSTAGFSGNQIWNNNGGNSNAQMSGGVSIGTNMCGTDTICP